MYNCLVSDWLNFGACYRVGPEWVLRSRRRGSWRIGACWQWKAASTPSRRCSISSMCCGSHPVLQSEHTVFFRLQRTSQWMRLYIMRLKDCLIRTSIRRTNFVTVITWNSKHNLCQSFSIVRQSTIIYNLSTEWQTVTLMPCTSIWLFCLCKRIWNASIRVSRRPESHFQLYNAMLGHIFDQKMS